MRRISRKELQKMVMKGLISPEQALSTLKGQPPPEIKGNKYRACKTTVDNVTFHSRKEADRYLHLKMLQAQGIIKDLILQPKFVLQEGFKTVEGEKIKPITYVADFQYTECETGATIVEDVKGMKTKDYLLKRKLFLKLYPQYKYIIT
jgi:hypothetical protein